MCIVLVAHCASVQRGILCSSHVTTNTQQYRIQLNVGHRRPNLSIHRFNIQSANVAVLFRSNNTHSLACLLAHSICASQSKFQFIPTISFFSIEQMDFPFDCKCSGSCCAGSRTCEMHVIPSDSIRESFKLIVQSVLPSLRLLVSSILTPLHATTGWIAFTILPIVAGMVGGRFNFILLPFRIHQNHKNEYETFLRHKIIISNQCVARTNCCCRPVGLSPRLKWRWLNGCRLSVAEAVASLRRIQS